MSKIVNTYYISSSFISNLKIFKFVCLVFSFRLRLLLDSRVFVDYGNKCYFNTTDMSLIKMRLDDAIMDFNEKDENTDQFLLNDVSKINSGIMKLVSMSLRR